MDVIYLVILLMGVLTAFALETHYQLGTKYQEFSTIFKSFVTLTEFLYSIKLKELTSGPKTEFEIFLLLVPYMISIRFLMLTLFYATSYMGYSQLKKNLEKKTI